MTADDSKATLETIGPELITQIFSQLPTFSDVFALAATCHWLREVYSAHVPPIYDKIAPRNISCLCQARRFLHDQGGPAEEASLSTKDIRSLVRNSHMVERAILQFERYMDPEDDGTGEPDPSSLLTPTERQWFVPAYYKLWDLIRSDPSMWSLKIEALTLKQLYYLFEMTSLTQSIGQGEEQIPSPNCDYHHIDCVDSIHCATSKEHLALGEKVWARIQDISQQMLGQEAQHPWTFAKLEGFMDFLITWAARRALERLFEGA